MLYPAFPVLHQTFVLWEALALQERGLPLSFYSIKPAAPESKQQPEARPLLEQVRYLPSPLAPEVWKANLRVLRSLPGRYGWVVRRVLAEWRQDREMDLLRQRGSRAQVYPSAGWRGRLEEVVNTSPSVYLFRSLALLPLAAFLGEILRHERVAVVHAHWATFSTTLALYLKWLFGIRFSFTAHAYDIYLMPILLPVKLREAELVVTCARVNAEFLRGLRGGQQARLLVNYHGVDLKRFAPRPKPQTVGTRARIVSCGSLRIYKGHHVLIAALAKMRHEADCVIIGDGPQRRALERLAEELGVRDRVEFTGALSQERAALRYAEADVFVLASTIVERAGRQDVIPNVLVEAMAMQLPVVSSALPGIRELIEDGVHGRLVPAGDPAQLATAIDELLDQPVTRTRLAAAGRRRVIQHFDREKNVTDLAQQLKRISGNSGHQCHHDHESETEFVWQG